MKRILIAVAVLVLVLSIGALGVFAAEADRRGNYTDRDGDCVCDNRGQSYRDEDGDGVCGNRGQSCGKGRGRHCN